ncbi:hypothetical protein BZG36_04685, partial [Bifiguratus adelaidae]
MEKFKEKLASLRAESDAANARAEAAEQKAKALEAEHTQKDHEILSLQIRIKNLEEQLEKAEGGLSQTTKNYKETDLKAENLERRVTKLEQELNEKDQAYEALEQKYQSVKNEMDELTMNMQRQRAPLSALSVPLSDYEELSLLLQTEYQRRRQQFEYEEVMRARRRQHYELEQRRLQIALARLEYLRAELQQRQQAEQRRQLEEKRRAAAIQAAVQAAREEEYKRAMQAAFERRQAKKAEQERAQQRRRQQRRRSHDDDEQRRLMLEDMLKHFFGVECALDYEYPDEEEEEEIIWYPIGDFDLEYPFLHGQQRTQHAIAPQPGFGSHKENVHTERHKKEARTKPVAEKARRHWNKQQAPDFERSRRPSNGRETEREQKGKRKQDTSDKPAEIEKPPLSIDELLARSRNASVEEQERRELPERAGEASNLFQAVFGGEQRRRSPEVKPWLAQTPEREGFAGKQGIQMLRETGNNPGNPGNPGVEAGHTQRRRRSSALSTDIHNEESEPEVIGVRKHSGEVEKEEAGEGRGTVPLDLSGVTDANAQVQEAKTAPQEPNPEPQREQETISESPYDRPSEPTPDEEEQKAAEEAAATEESEEAMPETSNQAARTSQGISELEARLAQPYTESSQSLHPNIIPLQELLQDILKTEAARSQSPPKSQPDRDTLAHLREQLKPATFGTEDFLAPTMPSDQEQPSSQPPQPKAEPTPEEKAKSAKKIADWYRSQRLRKQAKQTKEQLRKLEAIARELDQLEKEFPHVLTIQLDLSQNTETSRVQDLLKMRVPPTTRENRLFNAFGDRIIKTMIKLDEVESHGSEVVRHKRKELLKRAERLLKQLDDCGTPLLGPFVRALGGLYHFECFVCQDCGREVANKFFPMDTPSGETRPLCERDYFRRLNLLCENCAEPLRGSYITALDKKFHIEHFTCSVCPTVFGADDSYYEHDGKVYCYYHYSLDYAVKCAGCQTAILKQFVEINRNS